MAGNRKKKEKRKKDPNSPDFQTNQPEQKRTTMDINNRSPPHPQASGSFTYSSYTQAPPQQNMPYSQPYGYYSSSPPQPVPISMSQLTPLPVSPPVSFSQGQSHVVLSGDVVVQLFQRLDMMDTKT